MTMRKMVTGFALLMLSLRAVAMDGVFDRRAEVDGYIAQLNGDLSQEALIAVAKPIYVSGISDERLAQALSDRLLRDLPTLNSSRDSSQYGAWMIKALGSTGTERARVTIEEVKAKTKVPRIKSECADQLHELPWERRKNEIMASRANYNEGDDMRVSQLLNLLKTDDFSYKQDAAYRMSWDKILDPRLMEEIAVQLQAFADKGGVSKDNAENVAMSHYAKMLGYSGNKKYLPLLQTLYKSKKTDYMVHKQANAAIGRLD
jgi:hypothetical protein